MSTPTVNERLLAARRLDLTGGGAGPSDEPSRGRVELWNPWTGEHRVGTATDELIFVSRLRELAPIAEARSAAPLPKHQRHDITALVTALRGRIAADDLLRQAPGLNPSVLLAAYEDLEDRRARSELAWRCIVDAPTAETVAEHGETAAQLLPVVMSHLRALRLRRSDDARRFAETIRGIDAEIDATVATVAELEAKLNSGRLSVLQAQQVADLLFDGYGDGAWSISTFLAPRVGALVPQRVASLLREDCRDALSRAS